MSIRSRVAAAFVCLVALSTLFVAPPGRAQGGLTLAISQPDGSTDRIAAGRDYATEILGDPWDMNETDGRQPRRVLRHLGRHRIRRRPVGHGGEHRSGALPPRPGHSELAATRQDGQAVPDRHDDLPCLLRADERERRELVPGHLVHGHAGRAGRRLRVHPDDARLARLHGRPRHGADRRRRRGVVGGAACHGSQVRSNDGFGVDVSDRLGPPHGDRGRVDELHDLVHAERRRRERRAEPLPGRRPEFRERCRRPRRAKAARGHGHFGEPAAFDLRSGQLLRRRASVARLRVAGAREPVGHVRCDRHPVGEQLHVAVRLGRCLLGDDEHERPVFRAQRALQRARLYRRVHLQELVVPDDAQRRRQFQVFWQRTDSGTVFATPFIPTNAGSQIYTVDLGADPNWSGQVRMLRIDPATAAGVSVSVDWVSLNTGPGAVSSLPVTVTAASPGRFRSTRRRSPACSSRTRRAVSTTRRSSATTSGTWPRHRTSS